MSETFIKLSHEFFMKLKCSEDCKRAYISISETSLVGIIKDFLDSLETINSNPVILQQFYDYIKIKFSIPCEKGMLFVERITMDNVFKKFRLKTDSTNSLANKKMELYQWIAPRHLEINEINITKIVKILRKVESTEVPSVKIFYLMSSIKNLYEKVGRDVGLDGFFPYLVYCFLKANIQDLYAHIHYINLFKRKYDKDCSSKCMHGFQIPVECRCLLSRDWKNEDEYYLTTALAVVDYIAKLEFYNLKVDHKEFDSEISKSLQRFQTSNKKDESSSTFELGREL